MNVELVTEPSAVIERVRAERRRDRGIGLVATMGALHLGHEALIVEAAARHDVVVVSIFVNPLQFDRRDDLDRYPRDLTTDLEVIARSGARLCFAPCDAAMYPGGAPTVRVDPGPLGARYEGAARPGHFAGVATVVTKLLAIVNPDAAYFGEKDYQQLVIVRRLTVDLSLPTRIVGVPTVREADGLARSSRNARLAPSARRAAPVLYRALVAGREAAAAGAPDDEVEQVMSGVVATEPLADLDYGAVTGPDLEQGEPDRRGPLRLLVAATVGGVRLIDNVAAQR